MNAVEEKNRGIARRLFDLALPVIGLNVLSVLSLAVDTAMCGRMERSESALAALGFATQVVFLLMVVMLGLSVGAVAMVARAHGAEEHERVNHVLHQASMLTVLVSAAVAIVGNLVAPAILRALGASGETLQLGLDYLRPSLGGTVFYYLSTLFASVLRGVGNTRLAFVIALVSNGLNVLFNYALILGNWGAPALGVAGAAIGTVASQAIGVVIMVAVIRRGAVEGLGLPMAPRRLDLELARSLARIGTPAALDLVILNVGFATILGMLGRIDELAVAAHGLGLRVQALAFVPGLSVSLATAAMVGNALGAGNVEEARLVVRASVVLCTAIMSTLAILIIASAESIVKVVFDVPPGTHLSRLSVSWMELLGYGMPLTGAHIAFVGMFRGSGDTSTSLWINVFGTVLVQIPLSYLLGFTFELGAWGVWLAFPLSFLVKAGLGAWQFRTNRWARVGAHA